MPAPADTVTLDEAVPDLHHLDEVHLVDLRLTRVPHIIMWPNVTGLRCLCLSLVLGFTAPSSTSRRQTNPICLLLGDNVMSEMGGGGHSPKLCRR